MSEQQQASNNFLVTVEASGSATEQSTTAITIAFATSSGRA